ncbi:hypothetical protein NE865_10516 [Phthorimaea operculella]|nr:hypothetical protein NE865_10516 [Phthorimaea operculella]
MVTPCLMSPPRTKQPGWKADYATRLFDTKSANKHWKTIVDCFSPYPTCLVCPCAPQSGLRTGFLLNQRTRAKHVAAMSRTPPPLDSTAARAAHGPRMDKKQPAQVITKSSPHSGRSSSRASTRKRLESKLRLAEIEKEIVKLKLKLGLDETESSQSSHTSVTSEKGPHPHRTIDEWIDDGLDSQQDGGHTIENQSDHHQLDENVDPSTSDLPSSTSGRRTVETPRSAPTDPDEYQTCRTFEVCRREQRTVFHGHVAPHCFDDCRHVQRTDHQGHAEPQRRSDILELANVLRDVVTIPKQQNSELLARLATSKDLPVFSGDPLEWLQFKEAYSESTRMCKFSDTENMWRLRKSIKGEARQMVASLLIGNNNPDYRCFKQRNLVLNVLNRLIYICNPDTVMSTLQLKYGSPENMINRMVAQMKKLHPLPERYHSDIVNFSIQIQNFVTATKAIDLPEYLHSPELVGSILTKLPTALLDKWATYVYDHQHEKSKFELLNDFLHKEATTAATSGVCYLPTTQAYAPKPRRYPAVAHNVLTSAGDGIATVNVKHNDRTCKYCKGEVHVLDRCAKFKRALRKDRWSFARMNNLCYQCLRARHVDPATCRGSPCDVEECGQPHHRLLHWTARPREPRRDEGEHAPPPPPPQPLGQPGGEPRGVNDPDDTVAVAHTTAAAAQPRPITAKSAKKVLLKVVPVTLCGPNEEIHTHALLDDGATVSLIAADVADRVGLHGQVSTLRARSAWESGDLVCKSETVNLRIKNSDGNTYHLDARKLDNLNLPMQTLSDIDLSQYEHVNHKFDFCYCDEQPKILIGQDFYDLIVPIVVIKGKAGEPYVTKTPLGWCVHGPVSTRLSFNTYSNDRSPSAPTASAFLTCADCSVLTTTDNDNSDNDNARATAPAPSAPCDCFDLHEFVRKSFSLDSSVLAKPRKNKDELRAIEILNQTSEFVDGRWYVGLPWKEDVGILPDSLPNALRRLQSVERKMLANADYASRYRERIQHLLDT